MSRITRRLILTSILVLFISSAIPNIFLRFFGDVSPRFGDVEPITALLIAVPTIIITLSLFSYFINRILVKRIKVLNSATKKVIEGDYEISIQDPKNDELSELANSFNDMTEALNKNEYVNKSFVRNFSHEFKTPLSTIKGYAELIDMDDSLDAENRAYLEIIINESKRLSNLSQNILLISQMDHQIIVPKKDTFNLTEELRKVVQNKMILFDEKEITFDLNVEEITITSNKDMLNHVLLNLIDNALKYTHKGDTISINIYEKDDNAYLEMSNPLYQSVNSKDVFTMFYTSSNSSHKSSGVGLSLVQKIIDKLGGEIEADTNNNQFKISLKIKK